MQPEQATFLLNFLLPQIEREHQLTKKVIEAVPAGKEGYQPDPRSMTGFDLAWHIASTESMFMDSVAAGEFRFGGGQRPENIRSSADVAAWYNEHFPKSLDRVRKLSVDQLLKPIDFRGVFNFPAVVYLELMQNHSIHHRGQLSAYLRPMGAKVPSIYGGSADEPLPMAGSAAS